jgi:hypothetical protein
MYNNFFWDQLLPKEVQRFNDNHNNREQINASAGSRAKRGEQKKEVKGGLKVWEGGGRVCVKHTRERRETVRDVDTLKKMQSV